MGSKCRARFHGPAVLSYQSGLKIPTALLAVLSWHTLVLLLGAVPPQSPGAPRVRWWPQRPVQGSLIQLEVRLLPPDSALTIEGELAGEPLHFVGTDNSTFRALAGIPVDADDTITAQLVIARERRAPEELQIEIPVAQGKYLIETLTVAPEFGRPPDPALAARIAAESQRALEIGRLSHETEQLWGGPFIRPRPGRLTSGFGDRREFNGMVQSRHMGVDFPGAKGAPVRAANRGIVALVADFYLGGKVIYVDHGAGLVTGYLHLSRIEVAPAARVDRGQIIGRVGATGRVTAPHLHWLARYGRVTINPLTLLELGRSSKPR